MFIIVILTKTLVGTTYILDTFFNIQNLLFKVILYCNILIYVPTLLSITIKY